MKKNDKKEKINPLVKEQKTIKNIKVSGTNDSDDSNVVKSLVIIIIVITVLIGAVYVGTELIKKDPEKENEVVTGSINYDKIAVGTLLNRDYDEYYVLAYSAEDKNAVLYSTILTKYMNKEKSNKIYFCDLDNTLNKKYYNVNNDNVSNPKATKIEDLDFGEVTLLHIKDGKINKYVEALDEIKEILK